jgi:hypothetical protein
LKKTAAIFSEETSEEFEKKIIYNPSCRQCGEAGLYQIEKDPD